MEKVYFVGETLTYETTIAIDAPFFLMAGGGKERGGRGRCKLGMSVVTGPPNVAHTYLPLHVRGGEKTSKSRPFCISFPASHASK